MATDPEPSARVAPTTTVKRRLLETVEAAGRRNPEVSLGKRPRLDDAFQKDFDTSQEVISDFDDGCIAEFGTKLPVADHEFFEGGSYLKFPLDLLVIFLVVRKV